MIELKKPVTPKRILELEWGYAKTQTLAAAVELGVFTHAADGKETVSEIARAARCSRRGMRMLLDALAGIRLLTKDGKGSYRLSADSREFLVKGKPAYLGDICAHAAQLADIWRHLASSVRSGKPYEPVNERREGEQFILFLVRALFAMNYPAAKYAASHLKRKNQRVSAVLDVAAGSGVWGIALAQEFRDARVTALDFPPVLNVTREYVKRHGVADRYEYIKGDLREASFGKERYDLIMLGHICHSEGEAHTRILLKKSFKALEAGGNLLIADFLPNDARTAPEMPLLFALNMLLNTGEGGVFTIGEFRKWLSAEGFRKIEVLRQAPSVSPLIVAKK